MDHILAEKLFNGLGEIDGVTIYGPMDSRRRVGIVAFNVKDLNPYDVALTLDNDYIAVRSGHHCALPLMKELFKLKEGT